LPVRVETPRQATGQRHRHHEAGVGAYFVCGMQLIFLATHLPSYLALCGMDPM